MHTMGAVCLVVLVCIVSSPGGSVAAEKFAGDFLTLGSGARALGMGSASVAVADDATAAYYNPAGLAGLSSRQVNVMHSEQFGGLENYNTITAASRVSGDFYGALGLVHLGVGNIKYTRLWDPSKALSDSNRVEVASREDAADYALFVSGGKRFTDRLDAGASVKIIRRSVGPDTAWGYGLDLGAKYRISRHWRAAALLRDATGTTIAWDGRSNDRIAPTLDAGFAYLSEVPVVGGEAIVSASMLFFGDSPETKGIDTMNIGLEYIMSDIIAFRLGSTSGNGTFGVGIERLPLISSTSLDYAFLSHRDLDSTHRISLDILF